MEVGKVLISAAEIETKINEMGRQITEDYQGGIRWWWRCSRAPSS